ncbi:retrovirus-related pol polyprotein from transposon TNT 1-94 [Tanacetum coccineum]
MNKYELETMSMDDIYNNLKVYEPEVKGTSSSNTSTYNIAFVSSNNFGSTNEAVNTAHGVSAVSTQVSAANSTNVDNLSDTVICAFFSSQPNNPQLANEDLQQLHPDDLKEMDLRCQMAMLTMRARRGDALLGSAELQETITTGTWKAQEGVYQWRQLLPMPWCHVMVLVDMTEVIRQRKDLLTVHSWLTHLQVLILSSTSLIGNFMPLKPDLSFTGLEEFTSEHVVIKSVVENSEAKASEAKSKTVRKNNGALIIEDWVSDSEEENVSQTKIEKKIAKPSFVKIDFVKAKQTNKTDRKIAKQVEHNRQNTDIPRGNQRNWNNMMSQRLGKFAKKTHPCPKKNMVPRAVLMKSGLVSVNTARQVNAAHSKTTVNAARPKSHFSKTAHSIVKRPIHKKTTFKNSNFNQRVNTVKDKNVNAARPKVVVNAARPKAVVNVVKGNNVNAVKALACWVWKPKTKVLDHVSKHNSASITLKKFDYVDAQGRSNRQFSVARTPQQNGVIERRNRTLIEAARTMLADSKLPTTFWAEAVNTACYVQNRVLVVKPHNKTPYELFHGRTPTLSFMRPFGCPVTILNTIDHLGKFDGKADEGFFVGYSLNSKAFRVFNSRTRIVEENLHIRFSESTPNVVGSGPDWLFDIDALTRTMNYKPIVAGTQSNGIAGTKASDNAGQARKETKPVKNYILLPLWPADPPFSQDPKSSQDDGSKPSSDDEKKVDEDPRKDSESIDQEKDDNVNSTNNVNAASTNKVNAVGAKTSIKLLVDPNMPALEDINIFDFSRSDEDDDVEANINNLDTTIQVSPILTTRIHKDDPLDQVIGDLQSATQTRNMLKILKEHGNKKDERGIVIRNKARLVAQGYIQEEEINYDEVFAPVARIEAIRLFLAYALFKDFVVYQMDVKSVFLYEKIEKEVYVCQPLGFEDPDFPDRVYKVKKALYRLHQAPRAWFETLLTYLLDNGFERGKIDKTLFIRRHKGDILLVQMSSMGELTFFLGLQVQQKKDDIFISQDKYVGDILKKFRFTKVKTASTPMETQKPFLKDEDGEEVDVHMYRSMIGSLMYLTSSRPDIMFAVCACARYQVNPKVSHLHVVKRIFRYLKGQPKLGLWYPKDSPFDLVAYTDSDYAGASLDKKSTTGGCQFLGCRLISWQCKKQTVVANSTTEAEYVAASSCCGQVLWIQNQLLDYRVFGLELKLMLLGINLLLLLEVNAARHNLLLLLEVNAARHNLLLLLKVNAARHKLTTAGER